MKAARSAARPATAAELIEEVLQSPAQRALLEPALLAPLRAFLARGGKGIRAELVRLAFQLAGGRGEPPAELAAAVELLHAGSLIVDDIEDGSLERRGAPALHRSIGLGPALNAGNWLYFAALGLLGRVDEPSLLPAATRALLRCHEGQALDLSLSVSEMNRNDLAAAWRAIAERKTGGLAGLACRAAASCAGAPEGTRDAIERFGVRLGVALQLLDDAGAIACEPRRAKGLEDVQHGRVTAAWALVAPRLREAEFLALRVASARVRAGVAPPGPLLEALRAALRDEGKRAAQAELDAATGELRAALGSPAPAGLSPLFTALEALHA